MDKFWSWWTWLWGQKPKSLQEQHNIVETESSSTSRLTTASAIARDSLESTTSKFITKIYPSNIDGNSSIIARLAKTASTHVTRTTTSIAQPSSKIAADVQSKKATLSSIGEKNSSSFDFLLPFTTPLPSSSSATSTTQKQALVVINGTQNETSTYLPPIVPSSLETSPIPSPSSFSLPNSSTKLPAFSNLFDYDGVFNSTGRQQIFSHDGSSPASSTASITTGLSQNSTAFGFPLEDFSDPSSFSIVAGANSEFLLDTVWNCTAAAFDNQSSPEYAIFFAGGTFVTNRSNCSFTTTQLLPGSDGLEALLQLIAILATAIVLGIIILATVVGNVFVIAAILLERNLQSVANYLILSLAVADLLVACLVMPLSAVYEVSDEWNLGPELCDMWTSCDVLCCTASILHLVAIALDRYWAVTNIDYIHQRTARRIGVMILVIWGLSFLVSIAPLLGWKDPKWDERVAIDLQCLVSQDLGYQIFATASSFYVPLLVILVLYWRIFQTARKRIRRRQQGKSIIRLMPKAFAAQTHPEPCMANASCMALTAVGFRWKVTTTPPTSGAGGLIATAAGGSGGIAAAVVTVIGRPLPTISETTTAFTNISSAHTSPEKGSFGNGVDRIENDPPTADISMYGATPSMQGTLRPTFTRKKTQASLDSKRERKAAKTLAIITGVFCLCWFPFFILAIALPTCQCDISPLAMSLSLWLGYFNSTLNPIIYTIFSPEFRHAFKRILCGRRNSIRRRTRCVRR